METTGEDFNARFFSTIKLKEAKEETLSKSISFLQQKQLFEPLIEAIRNTSMSWFNSIYQEEAHVDENFLNGGFHVSLLEYYYPEIKWGY